MRGRRALACVALLTVAACTAVAGLDGDFSMSGTPVQATPDAGIDASNDSGNQAPIDSGADAFEAGPVDPFDYDAGPFLADAGITCPDPNLLTLYCWQFDGDETAGDNWGASSALPGMVVVDNTAPFGGSLKSMHATHQGSTSAGLLFRATNVPDLRVGDGISLNFDFQVNQIDGDAIIGGLSFTDHVSGVTAYATGCNGPCLGENNIVTAALDSRETTADHAKLMPLLINRWYHARITLTRVTTQDDWGSETRVTSATEGQILAIRSTGAVPRGSPTRYTSTLGAFWSVSANGTKTNIDNLAVVSVPKL